MNSTNDFASLGILVAGGMGGSSTNDATGKVAIDPNSPFQDARLRRLCEIYTRDPSEDRRAMAKRTLRKEYPGEDGQDGDLSTGAALVLGAYSNG